jgi:transcription initiation factor TFIIH subunit 1
MYHTSEMLNKCHNEILCFSELVPADLERELKNLYMSLCELLRHFWTSFPPTTTTLEAKAVHMHEALHRFHSARLKPFEVRCLKQDA